ncbi:endothelin-converting enzyme 1 [Lasioglossum baleicum]|uniref:endothelin-converting enzyme 1 n=1 Tax=Lasioglossum baleicum TaxID=434251 RepID=UPI003FCE0E3C
MPSRGIYQVANIEEGKVIQRDQSYRSCVLTLIIFLFLCIALIVVGLLSRKSYNEDEDLRSVEGYHNHHEDRTKGTTSTTESLRYSTVSNGTNEIQATLKTTTTTIDVITSWTNTSHIFERLENATTTAETETSFSVATKTSPFSTTTTKLVTAENTSPISTESVNDVEETSTSTTTEFEDDTSPITESVTDVEETRTSTTTEFVTQTEEILTSPITTESVTEDEETITSTTTEFVTEEEEILTSPVTTESVTEDEETITSTTTEFVTEEEEILTSPITMELVTDVEEMSTSITTEFVTEEKEILTSPITTESVTDVEETSISTTTEFVTEEEEMLTSPITTESVTKDEETSTSSTITTELTTDSDEESTVEASTTSTESATEISTVTTEKSEDVTEVETSTSMFSSTTDAEFSTETILSTSGSEEETTVLSTTDSPQSTVQSEILTTTSGNEQKTTVCTLGECKNLASKMLFYMNHSVDPCDDFYEYACGGFEADPRIGEVDSESVAYNRIMRQLREEIRESSSSLFAKYYNSCMHYETLNLKDKIRAAKQALNNVGKFRTTDDLSDKDYGNFTTLVGQLLLHNSALLFDVSPELNETDPRIFTLKIGPTRYKSPFEVDGTEDDPCYASQFERDQKTVDLEKLYKEYKSCKRQNNTKELLSSIREAFSVLDVFDGLQNTSLSNISQYVETTVINIDIEIVQKFFANFPSKDQIRKAYLMKDYTNVSITELQTNWKIINWLQLIKLLTGADIAPEVSVQVYFHKALNKGLKNLEEFGSKRPKELNNALLGLYAQTLYQQLILPKHVDPKDYCLRVATKLLTPEASNLYISTFSKDELVYMNKTIHRLFKELKKTLKLKVEESEWTKEDRGRLVAKIDNLKVVTPDISYFGHNESVYGSMKTDKLTDNYFNNSITLMKRYRKRMYMQFRYHPGDPEQIWTYYTTPFESKGLVVYELSLVVIPFGAIDWSIKYDNSSFDYITLATIGSTIAHQIAHHFDANGIFYRSGSRHHTVIFDGNVANSTFVSYTHCQQTVYDDPLIMTLPSTGQTVSYRISQLTLNERLSETMGLRLAYDTLDRLRSRKEVHLPWLDLDSNQLFYLTYAQMHCTKLPLTSSYVSLHEDEHLPSRIRIFATASNNKLLGEAWECPYGSGLIPSYSCDVFPYLHTEENPDSVPMS